MHGDEPGQRQLLLLPELMPANDEDDGSARKRGPSLLIGEVTLLRESVRRLESMLRAEREAAVVMEVALDGIAAKDQFVPERHHHNSASRCRDFHTGGCPHACGAQLYRVKDHAQNAVGEAKAIRKKALHALKAGA